MTLYQKLLAASVPEAQLDHYYSDLYVLATPKNWKIIEQHCKEEGLSLDLFVKSFKSNDETPPRSWYDIPFAYDPYWEEKEKEGARITAAREHKQVMEVRQVDSYLNENDVWIWNDSTPVGHAAVESLNEEVLMAWLKAHAPEAADKVAAGTLAIEDNDDVIELIVAETGEIIMAAQITTN